jgi:hypothetical protein
LRYTRPPTAESENGIGARLQRHARHPLLVALGPHDTTHAARLYSTSTAHSAGSARSRGCTQGGRYTPPRRLAHALRYGSRGPAKRSRITVRSTSTIGAHSLRHAPASRLALHDLGALPKLGCAPCSRHTQQERLARHRLGAPPFRHTHDGRLALASCGTIMRYGWTLLPFGTLIRHGWRLVRDGALPCHGSRSTEPSRIAADAPRLRHARQDAAGAPP